VSDHLDNVGTMLDRALNEWVAQIVVCKVFWTKTQAEPTPELCDVLQINGTYQFLVYHKQPRAGSEGFFIMRLSATRSSLTSLNRTALQPGLMENPSLGIQPLDFLFPGLRLRCRSTFVGWNEANATPNRVAMQCVLQRHSREKCGMCM